MEWTGDDGDLKKVICSGSWDGDESGLKVLIIIKAVTVIVEVGWIGAGVFTKMEL